MNALDKVITGFICAKGGGGGGSGVVDYPTHMKDFQSSVLNHVGVDTVTSSMVDVMNTMLGSSPFTGETAYDPDTDIAANATSVGDLATLVALLSAGTGLDSLISSVLDQTRVDNAVTEFSEDLGDRLTSEVLPRFESGMRDINAVTSSAFALGKSVIEVAQTRQVAKYSADLHMKAFGDEAIKVIGMKLEYQRLLTQSVIEANRIKIVAKKEEAEVNLNIDEADANWDITVFQHSANMLASIGGGTAQPQAKKQSQLASAIGGAMTGAAAGAMVGAKIGSVGGPWGAVIGGVLGAASSFL